MAFLQFGQMFTVFAIITPEANLDGDDVIR